VELDFYVPGQPIAKGRPKFSTRGGFAKAYTPAKTVNYENLVRYAAAEAMQGAAPIPGPVHLWIHIGLQIPASWSKKRRGLAAEQMIAATKKPDADNVLKAVKDAINGVVFIDDAQVVSIGLLKEYSEIPGVKVRIRTLPIEAA